jgi:serine/threonine protein kinase
MVGQNIGKYRVQDRVGRGGMGTVYRAIDETLHREVAIKVLNAELNDPEVAKRFRAEAITVARLSHPGIATIYELFQHEGQWLMVMEFVRGETLEHLVERMGALSPQRAAELCMQALAALAHAHSMGVVHRDLKPANMMVTETGAIKIMDFGIARVAGTEHLTNAGFMMGTPAYMAPEQVMGHEIDARADLYAMGVVYYRLTTAKLPFKGETPFAMAQSQVNDPPTPIGLFRADLPAWVEQVVVRSLAKNPEERFQSAIEFHEGLARCLAGLPMTSMYSSSAPTELMMTPSRPMPTGMIHRSAASMPVPVSPAASAPQAAMPAGQTHPGGATTAAAGAAPPSPSSSANAGIDAAAFPSGVMSPAVGTPLSSASGAVRSAEALASGSISDRRSSAPSAFGLIAAVVMLVLALAAGALWIHSRTGAPAVSSLAAGVAESTPTTSVGTTGGAARPAGMADASGTPPAVRSVAPMEASTPAPVTPSPAAAVSGASPVAGSDASAAARGASRSAGSSIGAARGTTPEDIAQSIPNVKLLIVTGKKTSDEDAALNFGGGQIAAAGKGGAVLSAMPYGAVLRATYIHARDPRWDPAYSSPPQDLDVGSVLRTAKHWLVLQGRNTFLIFRLDDTNWRQVIDAVEARTSLAVDRSTSSSK